MNKIRIWLSHPWLPIIAALLAVGLTIPSLWNGLNLDDSFHRLILLGDTRLTPRSSSPLNLFCFLDGDPEENRRLINIGDRPWWTNEESRICFFRPLSSLTHWIDYLLWPNTPALMHLQNLAWYGILVVLVALLYRRIMGTGWVAGLAAFFFTVDDAHSAVGAICTRNALIACTFGVLCLMTHDRWRREGWRGGALLGPVCFALALISAEAGIATGAYLLAHALFLERGSLRDRIIALLPYGVVFFLWGMLYSLLGYGTQGIPSYTNPLREPLLYLVALFFRAPVYLLGQWALPPVFCNFFWPFFMHRAGLIFLVFLVLLLVPLIRQNRTARFWAAGMMLSLFPICATMPKDSNLLFVGLGTMGLLAQWFFWMDQVKWNVKSHLWRIAVRITLVMFILIHAVLAPISLPLTLLIPARLEEPVVRASESLPFGPEYENKKFVLVNTPNYLFFVSHVARHRALQGQLTYCLALTVGDSPLILKRIDSHTIRVQAETGSLTGLENPMYLIRKKNPMQHEQIVTLSDLTIKVLEVNDGLPSAGRFRFTVPLEDASLAWFRWQDGEYIPFTPPAVGESVTLKGVGVF